MKLHRIAGHNLASLSQPFELRLDEGPLARGGLFAVTGPTGAGKSTLLDALCLALYDTTPRLVGRGGAEIVSGVDSLRANDVRSLVRRGAELAWAEVEFTGVDDVRWIARWSVQRRPRKGDLDEAVVRLTRADGTGHESGRKRDTLAAITQKVGLTYESFVRSVLLAQNEFSRLLSASADERSSALEWITRSSLYSELSKAAFLRGREAQEALRELERQRAAIPVLGEAERAALEAAQAAAAEALTQHSGASAEAEAALAWARERDRRRAALLESTAQHEGAHARLTVLAPEAHRLARAQAAQAVLPALHAEAGARAAAGVHAAELARLELELAAAEAARSPGEAALIAAEAAVQAAQARRSEGMGAVAAARELDGQLRAEREVARGLRAAAEAASDQAARAEADAGRADARAEDLEREAEAARAWLAERAGAARLAPIWRQLAPQLGAWAEARAAVARQAAALPGLRAAEAAAAEAVAPAAAAHEQHRVAEAAARAEVDAHAATRPERARRAEALATRRGELARTEREHTQAVRAHEHAGELHAREARAAQDEAAAAAEAAAARAEAASAGSAARFAGARHGEAERLLRALQARQDLTAHRAALSPGEPCPLCGATEHPLAGQGALDAVLAEQLARVQELAAEATALGAREAAAAATAEARALARSGHAAERARLRAEREALPPGPSGAHPGTAAAGLALAAATEALAAAAAAVEAEAAALAEGEDHGARLLHELRSREAATVEAAAVLGRLREGAERAGAARAAAQTDHTHAQALAATRAATLDEWLAPQGDWQSDLASPPARELLRQEVEAAAATQERLGRAVEQGVLARTAAAQAHAAAVGAREAVAPAQAAAEAAERTLGEREAARRAVLDEPADTAEQRLQLAVEGAERARAAAAAAVGAAQARAVEAGGRLKQHAERRGAVEAAVAQAVAAAEAVLAAAALTREQAEAAAAWASGPGVQAAHALAAAQRAAAEADTLHAAAAAEVAAWAPLPGVDAAAPTPGLEEAAHLARTRRDGALAEQARLAERLQADEANRADRARLEAEHVQARADAEAWLQLREVIGHNDGKTLRVYAQSLTLARLLQEANVLLDDLAPRYQLQCVPTSALDLQIVDRDRGNEVRGVQTLSGGETFLLSLALALGLSGVAAQRQPLNCLFIDEGFGMLDARSLDQALAVLESLRQAGRTIGIISHVGGLAERIGVRVEVTPVALGSSVVRIVEG